MTRLTAETWTRLAVAFAEALAKSISDGPGTAEEAKAVVTYAMLHLHEVMRVRRVPSLQVEATLLAMVDAYEQRLTGRNDAGGSPQ